MLGFTLKYSILSSGQLLCLYFNTNNTNMTHLYKYDVSDAVSFVF